MPLPHIIAPESREASLATVDRYHDGTKHHFQQFARSLGYLDWASQPRPFRGFAEAPIFPLYPTPGVAAWNGPYLKGGTVPNDPWSNPYIYRAPGEHGAYDIISLGSDGQEGGSGTAADISLDTMTSARND